MTSKELISVLTPQYDDKSIHPTTSLKRYYELRSSRNVFKMHNKTRAFSANNKKKCVNSVVNIERLPRFVLDTSVTTPSEQDILSKKSCLQEASKLVKPDSNQDVSEFLQDADFLNLSDMEDDAFLLAKFLESNDQLDETVSELQIIPVNSSAPNESTPTHNTNTEQLLDMSRKETSANPDFDMDVAFKNHTPNHQIHNFVVENYNTQRNNEHADKNIRPNGHRANPFAGIDRVDQRTNSMGNYSKQSQNMLSDGPTILSVVTQPIIAAGKTMSVSKNARRVSTSHKDVRSTILKPNSKRVPRMTAYTTLTKHFALKRQMMNLFNRTCYNYVSGRFCRPNCKWNHNLPPAHVISQKMMRMSDDTITYMYYNFVLKNNMSFVAYFPTMCEVFGRRKMESILLSVISDCEKHEQIPFLKFVFYGLVLTGLSMRGALTMVTNKCCKNRDCYDIFLEIIIETDALYFIDLLEDYYLYGTISKQSVYKLLEQVVDDPGNTLLTLFIDILDKYSMYNAFDVDTFTGILPTVKNLALGNLKLSQMLNHIEQRMQ